MPFKIKDKQPQRDAFPAAAGELSEGGAGEVPEVTLTTKSIHEESGTRAVNEGGEIKGITEAASPQGTTIVARELFYNTPVRLKFLKKPTTEASKVAEVIARLILAHPDVSFRLIHNGKQIYASSGNGDLRSTVFSLYGRETASEMIPVKSEGSVSVNGLVGVGLQARSNRARQTFIVNGRTIRSQVLTQALEDGCRERVTIGHYPICVLNIDMPTNTVDVNVHPNKLEVRFSDEHLVYENVCGAVADSFSVSPLKSAPHMTLTREVPQTTLNPSVVQVIDTQTESGIEQAREQTKTEARQPVIKTINIQINPPKQEESVQQQTETDKPTPQQQADFTSFVTQYFGGAALRESVVPGRQEPLGFAKLNDRLAEQSETAGEAEAIETQRAEKKPEAVQQELLPKQEANTLGDELSGYSMVGVAFDTYIILQNQKQLIMIDQHAAHERILYEKLMREIDAGVGSQLLMVAQVVHVTPQDAVKIEAYREDIQAAGFDIEPFGDDAYQIRAVPNVLGVPQTKSAFLDMVDRLGELRVLSTAQKRRDAILQMACKKAVKGGDKLTMEEIKPLLVDMLRTNAPPTCPHGRPLVVVLERTEIEKRFKRIND